MEKLEHGGANMAPTAPSANILMNPLEHTWGCQVKLRPTADFPFFAHITEQAALRGHSADTGKEVSDVTSRWMPLPHAAKTGGLARPDIHIPEKSFCEKAVLLHT